MSNKCKLNKVKLDQWSVFWFRREESARWHKKLNWTQSLKCYWLQGEANCQNLNMKKRNQ